MSSISHTVVGHEVQYQSAHEQRRVGLWLIGAFLGGILIINSYIASRFLEGGKDVAGLSAFLGALLLGSKIPVKLWELFVIFLLRTLVTLPVIAGVAHLLF